MTHFYVDPTMAQEKEKKDMTRYRWKLESTDKDEDVNYKQNKSQQKFTAELLKKYNKNMCSEINKC